MKRYPISVVLGTAMTLLVFVSSVVAAPTATGAKRPLFEGTTAILVPWVNDPKASDTFTFSHVHQPLNGTASAVSNHHALEYVPNASFTSGTDSFTYRATDQNGNWVNGTAHVRVYDNTALSRCTRIGTVNPDGTIGVRTFSNDCTFYSSRRTRVTENGTPVTMDYFINWPSNNNAPKAVVVLIGGGDLNMNFSGNTTTGVAAGTGGGNFVVRTAQLFADAGYLTIAINKPSDQPPAGSTDTTADADQYRVSVKHAVDILKILKRVNTQNLPVFLAGTSRGAISAAAANLIATGVSLSSAVTSNGSNSSYLYVGDPSVANLQTSFIKRPVHVLWNMSDNCSVTTPADSQGLYDSLSLTTSAAFNTVTGGVRVTQVGNGLTSADIGDCQAYDYHGYFGIETTAVGYITAWLDAEVNALAGDAPPKAPFAKIKTAAGAIKHTNLANLTGNQSGLSYGLSHATTSLGGTVSINGSQVTYTPPAGVSNKTDYYVYFVTDASGGVGAGVITVKIGN